MEQQDNQQHTPINKIGRKMALIAWLMGLGLLTLFFDRLIERQNNPNPDPSSIQFAEYTEVVLNRNRFGQYVTSGQINGVEVEFLVDTGAFSVAVPESVARKTGLQQGQVFESITANGIGKGYYTRLDLVQIGEIRISNITGGILPGMVGEQVLLGMAVLKKLEFTQRNNQLILRQYR